jgi:hypothetical protein
VYGSYETLPLDDGIPQTNLTGIAYRSGGTLAKSDTLNFIVENNMNDINLVDTYSVDYDDSLDPRDLFQAGLLPPGKSDFSINGIPVVDTKGTFGDPIVVNAGNPIIVTWSDTSRTVNRTDLRWRVQISDTDSTYKHQNLMSRWMGPSNTDLDFTGGTVTWNAPSQFTEYLFDDLSVAKTARIGMRIKNAADTLRGSSQDVYLLVQPVTNNQMPVVSAGEDLTTTVNVPIPVTGIANDIDGSITSYQWTLISGSSVTLTNEQTSTVTVEASVAGVVTLELTVEDDFPQSASDQVDIVVNP